MTQEEYLKKVDEIHDGKITVLGDFKGASQKVLVRCNVCNHEWEVTPSVTLKGHGCRKCADKHLGKGYDIFMQELKQIHGDNIELVGEYVNSTTPTQFRCKIDGNIWNATPTNLIGKKPTGCDKCYRNRTRRTHEEYLKDVQSVHGDKIKVLGKYVNNATKIELQCNDCGHIWGSVYRHTVKSKCGCPKCSHNRKKKTQEQYENEVHARFGDKIEIMGKYVTRNTPILTKCREHNIVWEVAPSILLCIHGCSECTRQATTRSHDEYVRLMAELHPDIEVVGKYEQSMEKVALHCSKCNHDWEATPNSSIGKKRGCPICGGSVLERETRRILMRYGYEIETQYSFDDLRGYCSTPLRFDFAVKDGDSITLIECQGRQHREVVDFGGEGEEWAMLVFEKQQAYDSMKRQYCKRHGYKLVEIWYDEDILTSLQRQGLCT